MEKNIAAGSAARLSPAQVVKAKNTAVGSAARLPTAQVVKAKNIAAGSAARPAPGGKGARARRRRRRVDLAMNNAAATKNIAQMSALEL